MAKGPGRPKKEFNYDTFNAIMQFKATTKEFAADYLEVSKDTIDRRLKQDHNTTFEKYKELKMGRISNKLQEKAISMALAGDRTLLIFCLKNYSKWQDKIEFDIQHTVPDFTAWAQRVAQSYDERRAHKEKKQAIAKTERLRKSVKKLKAIDIKKNGK